MNIHKNARLTPHSRAELVRRVLVERRSPMSVATDMGVSIRTVRKWVARYQAEGEAGLADRSSRPHRLRRPTAAAAVERIETLRRQRWTGKRIAGTLGVSRATVSRVLRRLGLSRIRDLEPAEPVRRYQREHPGELIHIDIKKLGRFERIGHRITGDRARRSDRHGRSRKAGWDFVHVCIDDASRIAFSQILADERKESAVAFLEAAVAYYAGLGVTVTRVMTRQRQLLHEPPLPRRLQGPRPQAHQNPALHAKNQRQGRALHPDQPQGMGLRPGLPDLRPPQGRAAAMAPPI